MKVESFYTFDMEQRPWDEWDMRQQVTVMHYPYSSYNLMNTPWILDARCNAM